MDVEQRLSELENKVEKLTGFVKNLIIEKSPKFDRSHHMYPDLCYCYKDPYYQDQVLDGTCTQCGYEAREDY